MEQTLQAKMRATNGSTLTSLRRAGEIPAVVYGHGMQPTPIAVPEKAFTGDAGIRKALVELMVEDKKVNAMIHDVQRHPVSRKILHIDFYQVRMDEPIDTKVAIQVHGIEEVERRRGIVQQQLREVEVHSLPGVTPEYLTIDVSSLELGEHMSAGDIVLPEGVSLRSDANEVVATVLAAKRGADTAASEESADETSEA